MVVEMDIKELGRVVRFHRKRAGLTQRELSQIAGVGKATVFDIEKSKQTVQLRSIVQVLDALNITLTWESPLKELFSKEKHKQRQPKQRG